MLNNKLSALTILISSSLSFAMDNDPAHMKPYAIVSLRNQKVAVMERYKCTIFDQKSRKPLRVITTTNKLFDIAALKDQNLLVLSPDWQGLIEYNIESDTQKFLPVKKILDCNTFIAIDPTNGTLIYHCDDKLQMLQNLISGENIASDILSLESRKERPIACHPQKNEVIVVSGAKGATIVKLGTTPYIKTVLSTDFICSGADFAPDDHTIIISNKYNGQSNYFVCNLKNVKTETFAYQLIADNDDYVASKFHPFCSIVALLSNDNHVCLLDFITHTLIAKTGLLGLSFIQDTFPRKRLDFNEDGTSLAVALKDTWKMIDVPQNNLVATYIALQHHLLLPNELTKHIIMNIINSYTNIYEHLDLTALLNITRIIPATKTKESIQQEPQKKEIKAVYKRPPKNLDIYDYWGAWGSSSAHNGM